MLTDLTDRERYDLIHLWTVQAVLLIMMTMHIVFWSPEWAVGYMIAVRLSSPIFHRMVGW